MADRKRGRGRGKNRTTIQEPVQPVARAASNMTVVEDGIRNMAVASDAPSPPVRTNGTTASPNYHSASPSGASSSPSKVQKAIFAKRPEVLGTHPRKISLVVNHFPVTVGANAIYHYDVEVEMDRTGMEPSNFPPKPLPVFLKRDLMKKLFKENRSLQSVCPTYDGNKNIYTCAPIPGIGGFMNLSVELPNRDRSNKYKVKLQPVDKEGQTGPAVNLSRLTDLYQRRTDEVSQEAIMALDIVLRHVSSESLASNGRAYYLEPRKGERCNLSDGKMVWSGFYQSLRPDQAGSAFIVGKSHALFYPECDVLQYIQNISGKPVQGMKKLHPGTIQTLNKELKEVRFIATHLEHKPKFKCDGVTKETAHEITFTREVEGGKSVTTSVADYFENTHSRLRFPLFPCLKVGRMFFPMEVAKIPGGQVFKKGLSDKHRSEMIRMTITSPERSLNDIKGFAEVIIRNNAEVMKAYNIWINPEPVKLEGRIIDPPSVIYKDGKQVRNVQPRDGSWNLRNLSFYEPGNISNWVIWCTDKAVLDSGDAKQFGIRFCNTAKRMGLWMKDPLQIVNRPVGDALANLAFFQSKTLECTKGSRLDFVLIILRDKDDHDYAQIKFCAETKLGLMTQCVLSKNVREGGDNLLICNLLQKVNSKVGGRNCSLFGPNVPVTMFVGADVNHAGVRDREKTSFAAVVASVDSQSNRYASWVRKQTNPADTKNHLEIIRDVRNTITMFLNEFKKNMGKYPERIIFYRDGVSEGEFADLQRKEVGDIRAACRDLKIRPKITVVVVAKRHHTRLFPANPNDGVGKFKNIPPGTVVDRMVVHPVYYDFYLCSHFGIQGTSRPTHYTVLEDDSGFSADELQKMTYYLCHMSARCTRAESIPTPVKYAHLSALRHRQYVLHARHNDTTGSDDEDEDHQEAVSNMMEQVVPIETMQKRMFFV